jgi:hypothetical protein
MKIWKLLASVVVVAALAASAHAQSIFLSEISALDGTAAPGTPVVDLLVGDSATLYVWVTDEQRVNRGLATSYSVAPGGVIALTSASAQNPDIKIGTFDIGDRWQATGVGTLVNASLLEDLNAVTTVDGTGIDAANDGSAGGPLDLGYDVAASAFLLGQINYDAVGVGSTTLSIIPSALGIADSGSPDDLSPLFSFGSATINVTPEPASLGLIALGGLALLRRRH